MPHRFGRPKGHCPSWKQWEEGGVPMTVVFEVLSPSDTPTEMMDKASPGAAPC
jgi:Uma2 family endonuclease